MPNLFLQMQMQIYKIQMQRLHPQPFAKFKILDFGHNICVIISREMPSNATNKYTHCFPLISRCIDFDKNMQMKSTLFSLSLRSVRFERCNVQPLNI